MVENDIANPQIERLKAGSSGNMQQEKARAQRFENLEIKNPNVKPVTNHGVAEQCEDEILPLTGKPYFGMVMTKANVKPNYSLYPPLGLHSELPSTVTPVMLNYGEKSWDLIYFGDRKFKRFSKFKDFVNDNNLKVGDACVFELMECSDINIKFKVQILRGDFPSDLLAKADGMTSETPIVVD